MKKITEYEYDEQGRVTRIVEEDGLMSERDKSDRKKVIGILREEEKKWDKRIADKTKRDES